MSTIINTATEPKDITFVRDCSVVKIIIDQRRKLRYFNVPPPRYTPINPYPLFTPKQLDMRRKAEILKYNNNKTSTKTNNLTKKEAYALLAKGNSNPYSQFTINQLQGQTTTCNADITKPTWSTQCNVPGPPTLLYYDPEIPLYNYVNDAVQNINYSEIPYSDSSLFKLYTQNELEYVYTNMAFMTPDSENLYLVDGKNYQTRSLSLGNIVNTKYMKSQLTSYSFSIPIGIWMIGMKDQGIIKPECDGANNPHMDPVYGELKYDNSCYLKFPGTFVDKTTNPPTYPKMAFHIDYLKNKPSISVKYSDFPVSLLSTPKIYSSLNNEYPVFYDVSFIPYYANKQFYGIQYVGNLIIENVVLDSQPEEVYDVSLSMSYYYDSAIFKEFDMLQTGLFFNLSQVNVNVADGVQYLASPPQYIDFSYNVVQSNTRSLTNIYNKINNNAYYNFFNSGTLYSSTTPVIKHTEIAHIGPNSVTISKITGNFSHYNITRIYNAPDNSKITRITEYLYNSEYTDDTLIPNSKYTFKITPVLNNMSGSLVVIGDINTTPISLYYQNYSSTFYTVTINFEGVYTYYDGYRKDETGNIVETWSKLTDPQFVNTNLPPGKFNYYTFTPYLVAGDGVTYTGQSPPELVIKTLKATITSANISSITSNSVTITDISGVFDLYTLVRDGPSAKVYKDNTWTPPGTITDFDNRLISGYNYTYSLIPTIVNAETGTKLDGQRSVVGVVTIP